MSDFFELAPNSLAMFAFKTRKKKVLVASFYNRQAIAPALERIAREADLVMANDLGRSFTKAELIVRLDGIDVAIAADEPYDDEVFKVSPRLRLVIRDGVGFDSIDLKAASCHGVVVANSPVLHETVADLVFGLIIAVARKLVVCDQGVRQGRWTERDLFLSTDVYGKTMGIIGFGRVGRAVARRAAGFDMRIMVCDPYVNASAAKEVGVDLVTRDELLSASDVVTLHLPLTPESREIIDAKAISRMKDGAYLINAGRGELVNEEALVVALKSGKLAGAGLDVIQNEPPALDNPFLHLENVVLTPHIGSDTFDTFRRVLESCADNILLFLSGVRPNHVLNPDVFQHPKLKGEVK